MTHSVFIPISGEVYVLEEDFNIKVGGTNGALIGYQELNKIENALRTNKEPYVQELLGKNQHLVTLPKGSKIIFRNWESGRSIKFQVTHQGFKNFSSYKTKSRLNLRVWEYSLLTGMKLKEGL